MGRVIKITNAVMVQISIVSIKVPSIAIMPCSTGLFVLAAAWAMAALPSPASFEKIPLANPHRKANQTPRLPLMGGQKLPIQCSPKR